MREAIDMDHDSTLLPNEKIEERAYLLWELVGRPSCDGDIFWQQAVAELTFQQKRDRLACEQYRSQFIT